MGSQRKIINIQDNYWFFFGRRLAELSDIKPDFRVLDVGTGDGACLIPAAKKTGERGSAIGIDIKGDAVRRANENLRKFGILNATATKMDARQMSYPDSDFDYALCGFVGFGSVYDYKKKEYRQPNRIMQEIHRVLKLGGGASFSNWRLQEDIDTLRELTMKHLEESGRDPQRRIPTGYSKEDEEGIQRLMTDAGFTNIKIHVEDRDVLYNNYDEWFHYMIAHGIIQAAVGEKPRDIEQLKRTILLQIPESHRRANTLVFMKSVIYSHGTKTYRIPPEVDGKPTIRKALARKGGLKS